jgi:large conductance mechanosensitive channel
MKKLLADFKKFALRGSVMDLAIGVIIGAAFKGIVDSLVANIIDPLLGLLSSDKLSELSLELGSARLRYGAFLSEVLNFLIMAFVIFMFIKAANKIFYPARPLFESTTKACPFCGRDIPKRAVRCPECTSHLDGKR